MNRLAFLLTTVTLCLAGHSLAEVKFPKKNNLKNSAIETWFQVMTEKAEQVIEKNQLDNGAIIASPSRRDPDYYYHWTRDAALTMDAALLTVKHAAIPVVAANWGERTRAYLNFSLATQQQPSLSGSVESLRNLGEPKYFVDGKPFDGPWGRPQADGPALRALTTINILSLAQKNQTFAASLGTTGLELAERVLARDLEYVVLRWRESSFDLWEEVRGAHFYTRLAQYTALARGAQYFQHKKTKGFGHQLEQERDALGLDLKRYWNEEKGYILTTLDRDGGLDYKYSNLDSSVILAVLHTGDSQNLFSVSDDKILSTAEKLKSTFGGLYPINRQYQNQKSGAFLAPGIGRYAEDRYDGVGNSEGHPWFLATMALSEFHYRLAAQMQKQGKITITPRSFNFFKDISPSLLHSKQLTSPRTITAKDAVWNQLITDIIRAGDSFAERTRYHSADDGSLAEQFNRHTGFMRGASDLTWSYASVLTAWYARLSAEQK